MLISRLFPTLALFSLCCLASAASLQHPEEQEVLDRITEGLYPDPPEWTSFQGEQVLQYNHNRMHIRIGVDDEGHAVRFSSNGTPMTNERISALAGLTRLAFLKFGHSGQWHFKEIPMEAFSGEGFHALRDLPLTEVRIGGSHFGEAGHKAIATLPRLERLDFNHVPITQAGMVALATNTTLRSFGTGMMHKQTGADDWMAVLPEIVSIPNLEELSIREMFLTWDNALGLIAKKAPGLKRIEIGRGALVFPEDAEKLRAAFPDAEVTIVDVKTGLTANKRYAGRLEKLMTPEQFARAQELAQ